VGACALARKINPLRAPSGKRLQLAPETSGFAGHTAWQPWDSPPNLQLKQQPSRLPRSRTRVNRAASPRAPRPRSEAFCRLRVALWRPDHGPVPGLIGRRGCLFGPVSPGRFVAGLRPWSASGQGRSHRQARRFSARHREPGLVPFDHGPGSGLGPGPGLSQRN